MPDSERGVLKTALNSHVLPTKGKCDVSVAVQNCHDCTYVRMDAAKTNMGSYVYRIMVIQIAILPVAVHVALKFTVHGIQSFIKKGTQKICSIKHSRDKTSPHTYVVSTCDSISGHREVEVALGFPPPHS